MGTGGVVAAVAVAGAVAAGAGGLAGPADPDQVWRDNGLRVVDRATREDVDCAAHSFGQVQELLTATPCVVLDRMLFTLTDDEGGTILVSVAWVEFDDRAKAREFKRVEDVHGTGDIRPLPGALLRVDDVPFTALNYDSDTLDGTTVVVAETELLTGGFTADYLDGIAALAVDTPRPA
ncbi:hypothetical protein [Saccharothrix longispora]|uniref:hypothetical protein n=1 Tax=Saccharothrix longispora TaxID=33920 RepID=UPI0028FD6A2F|nr:hypothetical protein [Saccharothrix longispora]MDU0290550.1 hypothetical protein [Saccharothrix longispora]